MVRIPSEKIELLLKRQTEISEHTISHYFKSVCAQASDVRQHGCTCSSLSGAIEKIAMQLPTC